MLRLTIDNHRDSRLHLLITLSRKRQIQLFATMGDQSATLGDELFAMLGETSQSPAKIKPHNLKTI